jgi:hypothetical protein
MSAPRHRPVRGRGALTNPDNRFSAEARAAVDDGWGNLEAPPGPIACDLFRPPSPGGQLGLF